MKKVETAYLDKERKDIGKYLYWAMHRGGWFNSGSYMELNLLQVIDAAKQKFPSLSFDHLYLEAIIVDEEMDDRDIMLSCTVSQYNARKAYCISTVDSRDNIKRLYFQGNTTLKMIIETIQQQFPDAMSEKINITAGRLHFNFSCEALYLVVKILN